MNRPTNITIVWISFVSLLLALLCLPGIAGLLEKDFEFFHEQVDAGWNNKNHVTKWQALSDIYAWSFWRIGLRNEAPRAYQIFAEFRRIWKLRI